MMQTFRNSAKLIAIVLGVLMLIFVIQLSGIFDNRGPTIFTRTSAGSIDGQSVDARTYEAAVRQALDNQQRQSPGRLSLEDEQQLRDQVWDQFIQSAVLEAQYKKHRITVSDEEVIQAVRNEPPPEAQRAAEFQTDGKFDLAKYQRWLTSPGAAPVVEALAASYREQLRRVKLLTQVTSDIFLSDAALWQHYRDDNEKVTVSLTAVIPRNAVPDSTIAVTPAEASAWYKAHQDDFKRPATAFLSYVSVPRLPDASDTAAALTRARAVRAEITGGAPFAEVAKRESSDSVSAKQGGELGEWKKGSMDPAFDSAAFALPIGAVSEPVRSQFGFHIIQMESRSGEKAKGRHILIPIELSGAHRDQVDARADSLDRLSAERKDPKALEEVAKSLGEPVGHSSPVQEGTRVLAGNVVVPDAGVWAFRAKAGELSPVIETEYALYVFRLDSLKAAGVPPLEEIRGAVEQAVRDDKKWARARDIAKEYLRRVENGEPMAEAAKAMGLPNREFGPFPRTNPPLTNPVVVGAAFALQPGQRSGVLDTKDGLYILQSVARQAADSVAFAKDLDQYRARTLRQVRDGRVRNYLQALRDAAKIEDHRKELEAATRAGTTT